MSIITKEDLWNFIYRYWAYAVVVAVVIALLKIDNKIIDTVLTLAALELLALAFSSFASFVFTEMKFVKDSPSVLGIIFLGVHLLIGLGTFGIYYVQFAR